LLSETIKTKMPPEVHHALMVSLSKALRAMREWSKEYDPKFMVADYAARYRDKSDVRRGLREMIQFRAKQVIEELINT